MSSRLQALHQEVQQVSALHVMAGAMAPAPEAFSEALVAVISSGFIVGKSYVEFDLILQGRQAMMRNDSDALCNLCFADGPVMQQLATRHDISRDAQVPLAAGLVIDAVQDCRSACMPLACLLA